ncbi:hypothetical protein AJ88_14720 [Mesorhizobium amorphae CCBAU 01583]|nr:hypothetical protein AJ88_14720 [Mesorhizobium amorphae CCBAU 01583]
MSRHGVDVAPFDDTMLISYVLDAGTGHHTLSALSDKWLGQQRPLSRISQVPEEARSASSKSTSTGRPPTPPGTPM